MSKKMLIDATHPEETRVVVVDGTKVEEFDFETINKRQLAGNIYLAKVTRVEPSLQAAFVDYGGNRHGFLAFAEIHPDYYQIPAADRQVLLAEEQAAAEAEADEQPERKPRRRRSPRAEKAVADEVAKSDPIPGMEVIDGESGASENDSAPVETPEAPAQTGADEQPDTGEGSGDAPDQDQDEASDSDDSGDDSIESVGDDDVSEEIQPPKKTRARRYKIQEVIKVRQIMLVQVVKEERGNKGAALTTYLSLAGRYCVLMPNTARGGGISRKITVAADRKKLKEIAGELSVPQGAGLIIRTAGSQRTRTEIRRDYEYLMRLWEQIRELTFKSVAPAPIYEEGDLIKRQIRDLYSKDIDEVLVEGERGYRAAKDFMKMIMPSHARNVKHYVDPMPLFSRYQVESYLAGMFNPTVQLKSGGYIVIGVTEALVAIDVNSGRATKEGSIEDTAYKTNCEAADEIARQLRLRDLAGLIVIDFIDMEERKNNAAVEKRFKERLKTDRARIQVGRISGFGLMEMSRQRLRPGMLESTTQPCAHCHGTGLIRSDDSLALTILRAIEEEGTRKRSREVLVKAPVAVANFLMNAKREHIAGIEARYGMSVRVEADPALISPDFALEKFKTATRVVPEAVTNVVSVDARLMAQIDDEDQESDEAQDTDDTDQANGDESDGGENGNGDGDGRSRRRRRRRRRGGRGEDGQGDNGDAGNGADDGDGAGQEQPAAEAPSSGDEDQGSVGESVETEAEAEKPKPTRRRTRTRRAPAEKQAEETAEAPAAENPVDAPQAEPVAALAEDMPAGEVAGDTAAPAGEVPAAESAESPAAATEPADSVAVETAEVPGEPAEPAVTETDELAPAGESAQADEPAPVGEALQTAADESVPAETGATANQPDEPAPVEPRLEQAAPVAERPKRRGWWSVG